MQHVAAGVLMLIGAATAIPMIPARGDDCVRPMIATARLQRVSLRVLLAVGLTESGYQGRPWPWALNIDGRDVFPNNREEAERVLLAELPKARNIDVGCMQLSATYHAWKFRDVREMLDPARNVAVATEYLADLRRRYGIAKAVAAYHTGPGGSETPRAAAYRCRVAEKLVPYRKFSDCK